MLITDYAGLQYVFSNPRPTKKNDKVGGRPPRVRLHGEVSSGFPEPSRRFIETPVFSYNHLRVLSARAV